MSQQPGEPAGALSTREIEILRLVATGATNQQIAQQLVISINTVKTHLRNIFGKLGVESRTEATLYAVQHGLVAVDQSLATVTPNGARLLTATAAQSVTPAEPGSQAADVPFPSLHWPITLAQRLVVVLTLVLVLAVMAWPVAESRGASRSSRLVDLPQAPNAGVEPEQRSRWHAGDPLPASRSRFAQAEVEGRVYVISGLTEGGWTAQVEVYDPLTERWERLTPKPTAVANSSAAVVGGHIYVPGGYDPSGNVRNVLEVYDPQSDTWDTRAPLPMALCAYAIAAVEDGFYLLGGWDGQHYLGVVYYYDVHSDTWRQERPLRVPRGFAAATAVEGRIYLLGGLDNNNEYNLCESFDPALAQAGQDPWLTHTPMRQGRAGHSVVAHQGTLYVVGGGWDNYLAYNERYDVANDVWSTFESPITGHWRTLGLSAVTLQNGTYLYAIGGWSGRHLSVVQVYQATFRIYLPLE